MGKNSLLGVEVFVEVDISDRRESALGMASVVEGYVFLSHGSGCTRK